MTHRISKGAYLAGRDLQMMINIALLCIVALLIPNPPVDAENAKTPGNMSVCMAWPDDNPSDIDLWGSAPGDKAVGYSNRAGDTLNLLRDDLGNASDKTPVNFECIFSRGLPAGEYAFNGHCYSCNKGPVQIGVEIRISDSSGKSKLISEETLTLAPRQERTVIRFRLDEKGAVVPGSVNRVFAPLRSANK